MGIGKYLFSDPEYQYKGVSKMGMGNLISILATELHQNHLSRLGNLDTCDDGHRIHSLHTYVCSLYTPFPKFSALESWGMAVSFF